MDKEDTIKSTFRTIILLIIIAVAIISFSGCGNTFHLNYTDANNVTNNSSSTTTTVIANNSESFSTNNTINEGSLLMTCDIDHYWVNRSESLDEFGLTCTINIENNTQKDITIFPDAISIEDSLGSDLNSIKITPIGSDGKPTDTFTYSTISPGKIAKFRGISTTRIDKNITYLIFSFCDYEGHEASLKLEISDIIEIPPKRDVELSNALSGTWYSNILDTYATFDIDRNIMTFLGGDCEFEILDMNYNTNTITTTVMIPSDEYSDKWTFIFNNNFNEMVMNRDGAGNVFKFVDTTTTSDSGNSKSNEVISQPETTSLNSNISLPVGDVTDSQSTEISLQEALEKIETIYSENFAEASEEMACMDIISQKVKEEFYLFYSLDHTSDSLTAVNKKSGSIYNYRFYADPEEELTLMHK